MAKIISYKTHTSGVPLGGIGSGSVELLPDGDFHYWQIYDPPRRIERCHDSKVDDGEGSTGFSRKRKRLRTCCILPLFLRFIRTPGRKICPLWSRVAGF